MAPGSRVVIIGNSGSGKSTLAQELAQRLGASATDLDHIHWRDSYGIKRDEDAAKRMVADASAESKWIIEGVYGWLAEVALPRATSLIWLDMPWTICREGLSARGRRRGASEGDHAAAAGMGRSLLEAPDTDLVRRSSGASKILQKRKSDSGNAWRSTHSLPVSRLASEINPRASARPSASRH
jgi:adenylate kinase family enzyme